MFLFVDEVYREFLYSGKTFFSALNLEGMDKHVIVFDSISKRFSACGAIVTRNKEVLSAALKFGQARLSPNSLAQIAGEGLFDLGKDYYDGIVAEYQKRRDVIVKLLNAIPGVSSRIPDRYAVAAYRLKTAIIFASGCWKSFSIKGATVMMAPGIGLLFNHRFWKKPGAHCICFKLRGP